MFAFLGIAIVLFVSTNVDDLFVLLAFFSNHRFHARQVVIGQFFGITVIYFGSVLISLLSILVPAAYIGLIGLAPIFLGVMKLFSLRRDLAADKDEREDQSMATARGGRNILSVALATVANGGDNISAYAPLFATHSRWEIAVVGLVFAMMTALWCLFGYGLVNHPALGAPLRRYGHVTLPFILVGFGSSVLYESGSFSLLRLGSTQ